MKNKKVHLLIALLAGALAFFLLNSLMNLVVITVKDMMNSDSIFNYSQLDLSVKGVLLGFTNVPNVVYLGLIGIALLVCGMAFYKLRTNFKELEESGSKGTSRFTTLKEIQEQYKSVPDKKKNFKGGGGVPISRYKEKIFVDDSPVNNLWIGTTRSGKGEMGMFPMIDIYSRAEKKASMVLNDPKGELYASSKETLEKRGYHVEVLNLDNPLQSLSYNILQLVIDAYEDGNMSKAEQYTKTISSMLYSDPAAKDKFWQDSASALCTALILGLCEKNIPHNKEKITMYTVASTLNTLASEKEMDEVTGDMYTGLDKFFDSLPEHHPAKLQYATVKFASGAGQTVAGIFANAFDKLSIFTLTPIAKMTSKNSFEMRKVGFGKVISGHTRPLSRINIQFEKGSVTVKADDEGLFTINHNEDLSEGDKVKVEVQDSNIKQLLYVKKINQDTGIIDYELTEETKDDDTGISLYRFEHFEKPTALFMITPDYDSSLHIIASLYVKQLYTELARTASNTEGGKCIREVIFILDEFGNMPVIEDMGSIITVCLSRNMRFNLVVQAYSQLKQKYEKDWETIDGNCANTIYILTTNNDTAEEISKKLGEKTIATNSRSGNTLSFDKNKTEGTEGRRLLTAEELRQLQEGETVVVRGIKRQDKKRNKITPFPIYNTGQTRMKYRYEYLSDDFDTSKSINDIDIPCKHANVDLRDIVYHFFSETEGDSLNHNEENIDQDQDQEQKETQPTINEMFADDNVLTLIENKIMPQTEMNEQDVYNLNVEQFINLMQELYEDEAIAPNSYNVIVEKVNYLTQLNEQNEEGDEESALPY